MIAARLTLTVCLLLAAANAHPHHQLLYSGGYQSQPPATRYYYVPQADAASVSSVQRYAAPVPVALPPSGHVVPGVPQYVLLYPGGGPQNNFVYGRGDVESRADEPEDANRPTIWNLFNVFQRPTTTPKVEDVEKDEVTTVKTLVTTTAATMVEETTPKPSDEASAKPEKLLIDNEEIMMAVAQSTAGETDVRKASLENLDENLPQVPQFGAPPSADGRQFTLVQRPQFFGNYDFLNQGNMHQRFGLPPGAVSNFLLFRNGFAQPGVVPAPIQPGRPLKQVENIVPVAASLVSQPFEQESYIVPGSAALAFQQDLNDAQRKEGEANVNSQADGASTRLDHIPGSKHVDVSQVFRQGLNPHFYIAPRPQQVHLPSQQVFGSFQREVIPPGVVNLGPGYQNVFLVSPAQATQGQGVVVDADTPRKDEGEQVEAEQAGPSVAQAKPQAIALAGVGGVAAASPVATAVVGPGGLAVSAPTATAVAGPSGGGALLGPAQAAVAAVNKHVGSTKVKTKTNDDTSYDYTYEENRSNVQ